MDGFTGDLSTETGYGDYQLDITGLRDKLTELGVTNVNAVVVDTKEGRLDAVVEQGGKNLSGGQRQRLTLARALVPQSDILIMDDSASALDYATDAKLRKAIQNMKRKPTVFIVSQRTSSIQDADSILVLDDGKIAGKGTHEELIASCDIYREIYETQFKKEEA